MKSKPVKSTNLKTKVISEKEIINLQRKCLALETKIFKLEQKNLKIQTENKKLREAKQPITVKVMKFGNHNDTSKE
jgi:hypothetical protein